MGSKYEMNSAQFDIIEKQVNGRGQCKTSGAKCLEVTEETRTKIHEEVWCMSWLQREIFVNSLVHKCNVGRHWVEQSESYRNALNYNLNIGSGLVPVCKTIFLKSNVPQKKNNQSYQHHLQITLHVKNFWRLHHSACPLL